MPRLWQAKRTPWSMDSGGPGSGLYKSIDGGTTWKQLKGHGLPEGVIGRIGVTVSGANPNRVWAVIEADKGGIYRSDDGGETWHLMTDDHRFRQRAWYYSHIFADPKSADTVYILNTAAYRSNDGGKTFTRVRAPHGDNHALWIDPTNPKRLINGNDGGATISTDHGESWTSVYNQPTAQFYHVISRQPVSLLHLRRAAGQFNSCDRQRGTRWHALTAPTGTTWAAARAATSRLIRTIPTSCMPAPMAARSRATITARIETQAVNPWPINPIGWGAADLKHRFQWTEPIVFSPHDPKTLYYAGEVLFKTTDNGMSWTIISPDLTRNDKAKQQLPADRSPKTTPASRSTTPSSRWSSRRCRKT